MENRTLILKVKENEYKIEFPNNRQYVQIHNMKANLANSYDLLNFMGAESQWAMQLVDMESHLTILCPKLIQDLAKPIGELSFEEGRELVNIYANQFRPWYNKCMNFVFGVNKEEKEEEKSE